MNIAKRARKKRLSSRPFDTVKCSYLEGAAFIVPIFAGVGVQGLGWMFSRVYYTSKMGVVGVGAQRVSSLQNLVLVLNRACFLIWA